MYRCQERVRGQARRAIFHISCAEWARQETHACPLGQLPCIRLLDFCAMICQLVVKRLSLSASTKDSPPLVSRSSSTLKCAGMRFHSDMKSTIALNVRKNLSALF